MPATNAGNKCCFSAFQRMRVEIRLNFLMVLHVHKELTDQLDLIEPANKFVSNESADLTIFGEIL